MMKYIMKQESQNRSRYIFEEKNSLMEILIVELIKIENDPKNKNSIMNLWKQNGWIKSKLDSYWDIKTYVLDSEDNFHNKYNSMTKEYKINFDWILEATEKNLRKILREIYKRFMETNGQTATEMKMRKINDCATKHNLKIYKEIPQGFKKSHCNAGIPSGSCLLDNGKSRMHKNIKYALLLI